MEKNTEEINRRSNTQSKADNLKKKRKKYYNFDEGLEDSIDESLHSMADDSVGEDIDEDYIIKHNDFEVENDNEVSEEEEEDLFPVIQGETKTKRKNTFIERKTQSIKKKNIKTKTQLSNRSNIPGSSNILNNGWEKIDYNIERKALVFTQEKKCLLDAEIYSDPYKLFTYFFDDDFFHMLCTQTNLYANQILSAQKGYLLDKKNSNMHSWRNVTIEEMKNYLAIIILMGMHSLPSLCDYWSVNFYYQNNIPKIMSLTRFQLIHKFFHLVDNTQHENTSDKLYKISSLLPIIEKFSKAYQPTDKLSIDEGVVPYKGEFYLKQFMPRKPKRWGYKLYMLADSANGYNLNTIFYKGKENSENDNSHVYDIVHELIEPYKNKYYNLYFDSYYATYKMVKELDDLKFGVTATFLANRKNFPRVSKKLHKHEMEAYIKGNFLVVFWEGTVTVNLFTNIYSNKFTKITKLAKNKTMVSYNKPECVEKYSQYMSGVDRHNQLCSYYRFPHRSKKYWRPFFYQVLQMTIANCYIIYKEFASKKMNHEYFRLSLVERLASNVKIVDNKNTAQRKIRKFTEIIKSRKGIHSLDHTTDKKQKRCRLCGRKSIYKCKLCEIIEGKERGLCIIPCFEQHQLSQPD